jgi:hypothetical protein
MEQIVNKIMKMPHADRVAVAHGLLMELEKAGSITCWNFWERETVKEIVEERIVGDCTEADLEGIMGRLNKEHDGLAQDDWHDFSDRITKHVKAMKMR